jgi:hypothetical protein
MPVIQEGGEGMVLGLDILVVGESLDVRVLVSALVVVCVNLLEYETVEDGEIPYHDGYVKATKSDGGQVYSPRVVDTSIDEGFMQDDGAELGLTGAMAWAGR